jgi:hypothetical protein
MPTPAHNIGGRARNSPKIFSPVYPEHRVTVRYASATKCISNGVTLKTCARGRRSHPSKGGYRLPPLAHLSYIQVTLREPTARFQYDSQEWP